MKRTIIKICALPIVLLLFIGCKKPKDVPAPGKAALTFPAQNAACTTGTVISATQSTITFTWTASDNTDSYKIVIKNLLTSALTTQISTANQSTVTLLRNTPYSWYVVSKSNATTDTTKSDVWKFYNSGPGIVSHPPFPADIISPVFGQNVTTTSGTINLSWTGSDPDNDIAGYDVYFGTTAAPSLSQSNVPNMFLNGITVTSGTTYYWKIVTKDAAGNTSDSGIFQFKVN